MMLRLELIELHISSMFRLIRSVRSAVVDPEMLCQCLDDALKLSGCREQLVVAI
jgi:hypothetical protein